MKRQKVSMGSTEQALVITDLSFDNEGFVSNQKAGILPFDPDRDPTEMLDKAGKNEWELFGMKNIQGFHSVRKRRELTPEELRKQVITTTGRSIINFIDETAPVPEEALGLGHETNTASSINREPLITHK